MGVAIRRIAGALGAEVSGVDLTRELDGPTFEAIHRAYVDHEVIFFRDQKLTPESHKAFGRRFGTLNVHPYVQGMAGHPEIMEIIKEPSDRMNFGGGWHSDMSFLESPSIGSILHAIEIPEFGGDTLFASMTKAYDALSDGLKATLETLSAVHSANREYSAAGASAQKRGAMTVADAEGLAGEFTHPVVKVHPVTGKKALYVNPAFTLRIAGWKEKESRPLLEYLFNHARNETFTCRFRWEKDSVAFWDNRSVWHFALNDYPGQRRHMRRVTVDAVAPRA
jgi:taurine dioxygenase